MTREYILENLEAACPIWFIDNPELRDHVMNTLQDSLLIPKPKFKVWEKVKLKTNENWVITITSVLYDIDRKVWMYEELDDYCGQGSMFSEDELELVEAAE